MDGADAVLSPKRLLVGFAAVTLVVLLVAASTSATAFGIYNPAWDGAAELRDAAESTGATSTIARETTAYDSVAPNETVSFVLSPNREYTAAERQRIETFVRGGGTLVVAGDYGPQANALLRGLGSEARLDGRPVRDEEFYYRSPAMPVARNVTNHSTVADVPRLTLNHGTAVTPGNASVLVRTSGYAYLDADRNGQLDASDPVASHPVATTERLGRGTLVVVGDPSVFINAMLDRPGNRAFVRALVASRSHVMLDYSHTAGLPPLMSVVLLVRETPLLQFLCGAVGTLAVYATLRRDALTTLRNEAAAALPNWATATLGDKTTGDSTDRSSVAVTDGELSDYLRERYPDWDDERVRRVVAARRTTAESDARE
jgi:hypothetical protein